MDSINMNFNQEDIRDKIKELSGKEKIFKSFPSL